MVNVTTKVETPGQRIKARLARKIGSYKRPGVRVVPRDDDMRRLLKHMPSGIGFRSEGSVEWPDDVFTQRRLKEGSVRLAEDEKEPQQHHHRRTARDE